METSMSQRRLAFCFLTMLVSGASLLATLASAAPQGSWREGPIWTVERVRSEARAREIVAVQGRVVDIHESRLFTIEDERGDRIVVRIPDHVQRETGKPETGEAIRVRGMYDHKTFLDVERKEKGNDEDEKTWGIRVSELARNVEMSGRNLRPDPSTKGLPTAVGPEPSAPAAPEGLKTVGTPNAPKALKLRMAEARQRALKSREALENANAAVARATGQRVTDTTGTSLATRRDQAQQEHQAALEAMRALAEEARASGLDARVIDLYEAGITKPSR
jgi:hypothetical protein